MTTFLHSFVAVIVKFAGHLNTLLLLFTQFEI